LQTLLGIALLLIIIAAAIAVTAAGIAMIRRDAQKRRGSGSIGHAMQELEALFVESKHHVLKSERAEEAEEESPSGDPPEK
jgi:type II secretory pathway pseudopilin PulG